MNNTQTLTYSRPNYGNTPAWLNNQKNKRRSKTRKESQMERIKITRYLNATKNITHKIEDLSNKCEEIGISKVLPYNMIEMGLLTKSGPGGLCRVTDKINNNEEELIRELRMVEKLSRKKPKTQKQMSLNTTETKINFESDLMKVIAEMQSDIKKIIQHFML